MRADLLVVLVICLITQHVHAMPPPPPEQDPNNLPSSQHKRALGPSPCRKKRSMNTNDGTAPGDRRFLPFDFTDPLCVYEHPIEIVKINSLTIRDGVILDNDIVTKDTVK